MALHKFRVGQNVDYLPSKPGLAPSTRSYKIIRCLPLQLGEFSYRIKSPAELFERVARESEIRASV